MLHTVQQTGCHKMVDAVSKSILCPAGGPPVLRGHREYLELQQSVAGLMAHVQGLTYLPIPPIPPVLHS